MGEAVTEEGVELLCITKGKLIAGESLFLGTVKFSPCLFLYPDADVVRLYTIPSASRILDAICIYLRCQNKK